MAFTSNLSTRTIVFSYFNNMNATPNYIKSPRLIQRRPRRRPNTATIWFSLSLFLQELLLISHAAQQSYNRMQRAQTAAHSAKRRWQFLRDCHQEQVLPASLCSAKDTNADGVAFPVYQERRLWDALKKAEYEKQEKFAHLHYCKRIFRSHCPRQLYLHGLNFAYNKTMENDAAQAS